MLRVVVSLLTPGAGGARLVCVPHNDEALPDQAETQSATLAALSDAGFTADFRVDGEGISGPPDVHRAPPEQFSVLGEYRFEGMSDPDDEALVMALVHEPTGIRGTIDVAYGPEAGVEEAAVLRRLPPRSRR